MLPARAFPLLLDHRDGYFTSLGTRAFSSHVENCTTATFKRKMLGLAAALSVVSLGVYFPADEPLVNIVSELRHVRARGQLNHTAWDAATAASAAFFETPAGAVANTVSKLLAFTDQSLPSTVVRLGSGEGFAALALAQALPNATILSIDHRAERTAAYQANRRALARTLSTNNVLCTTALTNATIHALLSLSPLAAHSKTGPSWMVQTALDVEMFVTDQLPHEFEHTLAQVLLLAKATIVADMLPPARFFSYWSSAKQLWQEAAKAAKTIYGAEYHVLKSDGAFVVSRVGDDAKADKIKESASSSSWGSGSGGSGSSDGSGWQRRRLQAYNAYAYSGYGGGDNGGWSSSYSATPAATPAAAESAALNGPGLAELDAIHDISLSLLDALKPTAEDVRLLFDDVVKRGLEPSDRDVGSLVGGHIVFKAAGAGVPVTRRHRVHGGVVRVPVTLHAASAETPAGVQHSDSGGSGSASGGSATSTKAEPRSSRHRAKSVAHNLERVVDDSDDDVAYDYDDGGEAFDFAEDEAEAEVEAAAAILATDAPTAAATRRKRKRAAKAKKGPRAAAAARKARHLKKAKKRTLAQRFAKTGRAQKEVAATAAPTAAAAAAAEPLTPSFDEPIAIAAAPAPAAVAVAPLQPVGAAQAAAVAADAASAYGAPPPALRGSAAAVAAAPAALAASESAPAVLASVVAAAAAAEASASDRVVQLSPSIGGVSTRRRRRLLGALRKSASPRLARIADALGRPLKAVADLTSVDEKFFGLKGEAQRVVVDDEEALFDQFWGIVGPQLRTSLAESGSPRSTLLIAGDQSSLLSVKAARTYPLTTVVGVHRSFEKADAAHSLAVLLGVNNLMSCRNMEWEAAVGQLTQTQPDPFQVQILGASVLGSLIEHVDDVRPFEKYVGSLLSIAHTTFIELPSWTSTLGALRTLGKDANGVAAGPHSVWSRYAMGTTHTATTGAGGNLVWQELLMAAAATVSSDASGARPTFEVVGTMHVLDGISRDVVRIAWRVDPDVMQSAGSRAVSVQTLLEIGIVPELRRDLFEHYLELSTVIPPWEARWWLFDLTTAKDTSSSSSSSANAESGALSASEPPLRRAVHHSGAATMGPREQQLMKAVMDEIALENSDAIVRSSEEATMGGGAGKFSFFEWNSGIGELSLAVARRWPAATVLSLAATKDEAKVRACN